MKNRKKSVTVFAIMFMLSIALLLSKNVPISADSPVVDLWEIESNDVLTSATDIEVNVYAGGSLTNSSDKDWYKFSIDKPGMVQLSFAHEFVNSSSNYWTLYLTSSENKDIYSEKFSGNATTEQFGTKIGLDAGTYYVWVKNADYNNTTAQYSVKVNYTEDNYWEREFNETIVSANTIATNTLYSGTIISSSDKDWYSFTIPEDGAVCITFGNEFVNSSSNYWTTTFYTEANTSIASYKWSGNKLSDRDGSILGLPKGKYYVEIKNADYNHSRVPYHFVINFDSESEWEREFNNTIVDANPIRVNSYINGSNMTYSDEDWYSFDIPKNGKVRISFEHEFINSSSSYWKASIFNSTNTNVFEKSFAGKDTLKVYTDGVALSEGTYYLKISNTNYNTTSAAYCFSVEYTTTDSFDNIVYEKNDNKNENKDEQNIEEKNNDNIVITNDDNKTDDSVPENEGKKVGSIIRDILEYVVKSEDEVSVRGLATEKDTITIPSEIIIDGKEYDVVGIEKGAFKNNKVLKNVIIEADLDYIGANAFYGCKKLANLTISGDVTEIRSKAFFKCKKLKNIKITTDAIEKVAKKAFAKIYSRASIVIPDGLEVGYENMFRKSGIPARVTITKHNE